jgi:hypothetical protein
MAVSPADFYAYSRATGVQIPDDPYEKAKLVPEIREFRQNQLRAPQQEQSKGPDPLSVGLGIGLALAGGAAGFLGTKRLLKGPAKSATAGVRQVDLGNMSGDIATAGRFRPRAANEYAPAPSVEPTVVSASRQQIPSGQFSDVPTRANQPGSFKDLTDVERKIASQTQDFTPRGYLEETGAVAPIEDLTTKQEFAKPSLTNQAYEAVESGIGQEEQRIDVKLQRHTGTDVPDVDIPQVEDTFEAFGLLPPVQRTLTKQEKEAKIFARLETEALQLGKSSYSATAPFGPEGRRVPPGPLLYPSQIPVSAGKQVLGVSSPTREFLSAFAQGDSRVQDVVRRENVTGFENIKTYGGVKGASLLEGDTFDPLSGELLSLGEQISGAGKTKEVLNPAWTDAFKTYWERRSTELPHTLDDYAERKALGKLNYQLPVEGQSASNNAQMFEKWDKRTSEALQDLYAETVGDTPQYVIETIEPKTTFAGTETQYRGQAGSSGEATGVPVAVLNPKGIVYGARTKNEPFISVGEKTLARRAENPTYQSGNVLRFKGEGGSTNIDVMPLSYDTESDVVLPHATKGQQVLGKAKVTRTALVPLQKAVLTTNPQTGQQETRLVNFSIDLTAPVGTKKAIDEFGRESAKTTTLQEAVNDLRNYHGKDYASLNRDVDALLKRTHNAYDVPVMSRTSFDKYDEGRNEFIRMLSGSQYEAKEFGFLTSVEGQKLPYTGPISPGSKGNRAENVANARLMLSQAGVPLDKLSDYLPDAEELGTTPRVQTTSTRYLGIPKPDIMSTGTDLGIRTSTYERISPRMGGAVTNQLRRLISDGAKVENIDGNVVYSTERGKVSYPENQLIQTLKSENQDAPSIAALVGRSIATEKTDPLANRKEPSVLAQERGSEQGYYYDEAGQRRKESITTPWGSFTGAARFAAGPASVASMGSYPQGGSRVRVKTSPTDLSQLQERNEFAYAANLTPGGTVRQGALQLGGGLGTISAGIESLPSESATIERYGVTGGQLKQVGDVLMAQAAYKKGQQPGPTRQGLPSSIRLAETPQRLESPYHVYGPLPPSSNLQQQAATTLKNTPINKAIDKVRVPGGSDQPMIPGLLENNLLTSRGYTPNSALDFYTKALERDAAQLEASQPKERMVRRQGRMVPLSQTVQPIQRNVFY